MSEDLLEQIRVRMAAEKRAEDEKRRSVSLDLGVLICPGCGGDYLHHRRVDVFTRDREDSDRGTHISIAAGDASGIDASDVRSFSADSNMEANPSPRRSGLTIHFICEQCDAAPQLNVYQHKGQTFVEWSE